MENRIFYEHGCSDLTAIEITAIKGGQPITDVMEYIQILIAKRFKVPEILYLL
jgi:hypothetical protein